MVCVQVTCAGFIPPLVQWRRDASVPCDPDLELTEDGRMEVQTLNFQVINVSTLVMG